MFVKKGITREQALQCVGEGWSPLVNTFYDAAEPLGYIIVDQVKEKFGSLRIYFGHYCAEVEESFDHVESEDAPMCEHDLNALYKLSDDLERKSAHTCEACGQEGKLTAEPHGWIKCLCETCRNEGH